MGYKWQGKLEEGTDGEIAIDNVVSKTLHIECKPATKEQQANGIDRIWKFPDGREFSVEYKTDERAAETGNVFIETVSVDVDGKLGWAYLSLAQLLVYYMPPCRTIHISPMTIIKKRLPDWVETCVHKPIPNDGRWGKYNTEGVLVPIGVFVRECKPFVITVNDAG